nr:hypothetical protein 4 [bacterium]
MVITEAQYILKLMSTEVGSIRATIDGQEMFVPIDPANRHYAEIMRQVEAGELTIQEAD